MSGPSSSCHPMTEPRFFWKYDTDRHRYLIWQRGASKPYQEIIPSRKNPAHNERYAQRCCDILNERTT